MASIRSLRPNVSREQALEQLSPAGLSGLFWRAALGPLRSVADVYVPFRLFQVEVSNRGKREVSILGLDAVSGSLDLYHFEQFPEPGQVRVVETRNHPESGLDEARARELVIEKVRRLVFTRGFFRMRDLRISAVALPGELHIPYWVGFYGSGPYTRMRVLDAVRRRFEGAKVRHLLRSWLIAPPATANIR